MQREGWRKERRGRKKSELVYHDQLLPVTSITTTTRHVVQFYWGSGKVKNHSFTIDGLTF